MTNGTQHQPTSPEDQVMAGEYVLGVTSLEARRIAEQRMAADPDFARLVARWQSDFQSFNEDYQEVSPPSGVFVRIEERLFGSRENGLFTGGLWNSVFFWRCMTAASVLIASVALVYTFTASTLQQGSAPLVAELAAPTNAINMLASYDPDSGRMRIVPVAAGKPDEKSLELWLVPDGGKTISLGVFPPGTTGELVIPADFRSRISEGTTFAVSLEPFGGSPTGQATGPVIAIGVARAP
ncbi:anti-sigma factor [Pararhizobium arenae]|uniref:anti-sigma factor n=1 Tax=Pararhizobium arenae TaxID=1856850 RepID=UPI00094AA7D8|nr:anti-sigma factor [Pararhizobium arenae]